MPRAYPAETGKGDEEEKDNCKSLEKVWEDGVQNRSLWLCLIIETRISLQKQASHTNV